MIVKLEFELSKVRAEIVNASAKASLSRTKADQQMAIHLKNATNAQAEFKRAPNHENRIEEYVRCRSRREVLKEIGARGFVILEEMARAIADERDARSLLADAIESEDEAFDQLKSDLLRRETRLRKAVDGEKSLRLLCNEREDELAHLPYEASQSLNYESYLEEQLQKKTRDLERLWSEVGQAKCECDELKARVDAQIVAKKDAFVKASALKVQLRNACENSSVRTDMITRFESELLKMKAEVVDTRAEAEAIQTKDDKKVTVYL
ncbi:uncharacterized protein [Nicotiana sylvestris]|uniref:uncharacterized protein n=1 Tax=Nicotiana sylvestris TaxID=4096 RepID=UPI00388CCE2D